ncbi:MAG: hypothetical protein WC043_05915 [Pseudobdellovibrionaceae bacterium]
MFQSCDFILGDNGSIVIVIPTQLPKDQPLTLEVYSHGIIFRSGETAVGDISCDRSDILQRIIDKARIGMIEFLNGIPKFPAYITAVADVEVMCGVAA